MNRWLERVKKIRPYNILKGFRYLKHYGIREFLIRLTERMEPEVVPYQPWFEQHRAQPRELTGQRRAAVADMPLISIAVPAYRTPELFLRQMIDSLLEQSYSKWELCIANGSPEDAAMIAILDEYVRRDERIRYKNLNENRGIAENTNAAFEMTAGDFTGLLDHDDLLAPNALYEVAAALTGDHEIDMLYTDEDKVTTDLGEHYQPHFKPDFSIDLLRSNNYICHFLVVRRTLIEAVGGFRQEYDGAQDYDFIFRCSEKARKICHIPKILYHWRVHRASTADNPASKMYAFDAGKRAIEGHLERTKTVAQVSHTADLGFYRVRYPVQGEPLISIIIPNKDHKDILKRCIDSITAKSTYRNYEIIIAENNSTATETFAYYQELEQCAQIRVIKWEGDFNYSAINNYAAGFAGGQYLLFLNNDIEVIQPQWLAELLGNCQRPEVGVTGCKLYYPDGSIQHAGTILGIGQIAGHAFLNLPGTRSGYLHKASIQLNYSAVTAACMMMDKKIFEAVGGFEEQLAVAFNDVDLCLRVGAAGYLVVYNPVAELYHHESRSRGAEDSEAKIRRFQREIEFMRNRWGALIKAGDPYYNKNLTLSKWDYSLRG